MKRSRLPRIALVASALAGGAGPVLAADAADAERGALIFEECMSCHAIGLDAEHKVGPHLNGIFGRQAGSLEDFEYSVGLLRAGADGMVWDHDKLDVYIENPKSLVSDTNMLFGGIEDVIDRADLLAFLRTYSASPADIVESAPTALPRDPDVDPAVLAIQGDPDYGAYLSGECITCHKADGSDEGIPSITGWPEKDFVVAMQAYKVKARVHPVMQMMAGRLSDEEIAGLAAYFAQIR